jgi:hypothetical protein
MRSDAAAMSHLQFFLICLAGWVNRNQQNVIEYLLEEVKFHREQLGKRPRFNDDQRRRLAAKAKKVEPSRLKESAAFAMPRVTIILQTCGASFHPPISDFPFSFRW